jgi:hypothetical protein
MNSNDLWDDMSTVTDILRLTDSATYRQEDMVRVILTRLAMHKKAATAFDFPRLEELAFLLLAVMQSDGFPEVLGRMAVVSLPTTEKS